MRKGEKKGFVAFRTRRLQVADRLEVGSASATLGFGNFLGIGGRMHMVDCGWMEGH